MNPEEHNKSSFTEILGDFKYDPNRITEISTFSVIYKGQLIDPNNKSWPGIGEKPVTLKVFQLNSDNEMLTWSSEMAALKHIPSLKQNGLMRSYGSFKDGIYTCLVSEYMNMGNLHDLGVIKESFKEKQLKAALWPVLNGLMAMHKNGAIHLDVKPTNIMQTREPTTKKVKTKLGDFGNVHIITKEHPSPAFLGGSLNYLAPEQCRYQLKRMEMITYPTNESKEHDKNDKLFSTTGSTKCDVWSLGVTSWRILENGDGGVFHDRPQNPQNLIELYETIYNTDLEAEINSMEDLSPSGRNWLSRLLIRDPRKRYTMEDAVNDEWFKEMRKTDQPAAAVSISASHSSTSNHSAHPSSAIKQQPAVTTATPTARERSPQRKSDSRSSRLSRTVSPIPQKSTLAPAPAPKKLKSAPQTKTPAERPKVQASTRLSITRTPKNGPKPSPPHSTRSNPSETTLKAVKPVTTKTKPSSTSMTRVSTTGSSTSSSRPTKPPVDTVSHQPTKARAAPLSASSRRETPATAVISTKATRAAQKSGDGSDSVKKKQQQKDRSSSPTN